MYPRFKILIDPIMTVNIISRDPISWPMTKSVEPESMLYNSLVYQVESLLMELI